MAEDEEEPGAPEETGGRSFLAFWTSLPGVLKGLAAVLTALVAVIGVWRTVGDGGSESSAPPPAATNGPATTGSDYARTPAREVLAEGRLTMRDDDTANLRRKRISVGDPDADLWLMGAGNPDSGILYAPYGGLLSDPTDASDKAACVAALNARTRDRVGLADLDQGLTLCLKTQNGEIAALRIVSAPAIGSPQLVFDYTLWS